MCSARTCIVYVRVWCVYVYVRGVCIVYVCGVCVCMVCVVNVYVPCVWHVWVWCPCVSVCVRERSPWRVGRGRWCTGLTSGGAGGQNPNQDEEKGLTP